MDKKLLIWMIEKITLEKVKILIKIGKKKIDLKIMKVKTNKLCLITRRKTKIIIIKFFSNTKSHTVWYNRFTFTKPRQQVIKLFFSKSNYLKTCYMMRTVETRKIFCRVLCYAVNDQHCGISQILWSCIFFTCIQLKE
jgi:hypothetical protein